MKTTMLITRKCARDESTKKVDIGEVTLVMKELKKELYSITVPK